MPVMSQFRHPLCLDLFAHCKFTLGAHTLTVNYIAWQKRHARVINLLTEPLLGRVVTGIQIRNLLILNSINK